MRLIQLILFLCCGYTWASAQELRATVTINHQQIQGTNTSVFDDLQTTLNEFINDRKWTSQQYSPNERIDCTFNITITKYDESNGAFTGSLLLQCLRPVFNSSYTTTTYSIKDPNFDFTYREYDQLTFRPDHIDNALTALIGYYAYLLIGIDMDTMSPEGGTDVLQIALNIANSAQNLNTKGWKPFENDRNRFAIINDYLDGALKPFRQMQYTYYREGLDEMAINTERARAKITEALQLLDTAHKNKPSSKLPQLFTEYKRDELVNIYAGKGLAKEKESLYNILSSINASYNSYWRKLSK